MTPFRSFIWMSVVGLIFCAPFVAEAMLAPADQAALVSFSAPASVQAGSNFTATLTVRNTGTSTWTTSMPNPYRVGASNPRENNPNTFGTGRWDLPSPVSPGQTVTIQMSCRAPGVAGNYSLAVELLKENAFWFNSGVWSVPIQVTPAAFVFNPYPRPDSIVVKRLLNTGPISMNTIRTFVWTNTSGQDLQIRYVRIWAGLSGGSTADMEGYLEQPDSQNVILDFGNDRYTGPSQPTQTERYVPADWHTIVPNGKTLVFTYYANLWTGAANTQSHFVLDVGFQKVSP